MDKSREAVSGLLKGLCHEKDRVLVCFDASMKGFRKDHCLYLYKVSHHCRKYQTFGERVKLLRILFQKCKIHFIMLQLRHRTTRDLLK
jgi:hypothetical protein